MLVTADEENLSEPVDWRTNVGSTCLTTLLPWESAQSSTLSHQSQDTRQSINSDGPIWCSSSEETDPTERSVELHIMSWKHGVFLWNHISNVSKSLWNYNTHILPSWLSVECKNTPACSLYNTMPLGRINKLIFMFSHTEVIPVLSVYLDVAL